MADRKHVSYTDMLREVIVGIDEKKKDESIMGIIRAVMLKRNIDVDHPAFGMVFAKLLKGNRRFRNSKYFPEKEVTLTVGSEDKDITTAAERERMIRDAELQQEKEVTRTVGSDEKDIFTAAERERMIRDAELKQVQDRQRSEGFRSLKRK